VFSLSYDSAGAGVQISGNAGYENAGATKEESFDGKEEAGRET